MERFVQDVTGSSGKTCETQVTLYPIIFVIDLPGITY